MVYIVSGYVIVRHQGSYGRDPLGEETQSGTNHHDSLELGRSEEFGVEVNGSEEEQISQRFCLATEMRRLFRCLGGDSA
jgi:hypothetical protein